MGRNASWSSDWCFTGFSSVLTDECRDGILTKAVGVTFLIPAPFPHQSDHRRTFSLRLDEIRSEVGISIQHIREIAQRLIMRISLSLAHGSLRRFCEYYITLQMRMTKRRGRCTRCKYRLSTPPLWMKIRSFLFAVRPEASDVIPQSLHAFIPSSPKLKDKIIEAPLWFWKRTYLDLSPVRSLPPTLSYGHRRKKSVLGGEEGDRMISVVFVSVGVL